MILHHTTTWSIFSRRAALLYHIFLCIPKTWETLLGTNIHIPTMSVCLSHWWSSQLPVWWDRFPRSLEGTVPCKARDMEPRQRMVGESQGLNPSNRSLYFWRSNSPKFKAEFSIKTRVTLVLGTGMHIYNSIYMGIYVYIYVYIYINIVSKK